MNAGACGGTISNVGFQAPGSPIAGWPAADSFGLRVVSITLRQSTGSAMTAHRAFPAVTATEHYWLVRVRIRGVASGGDGAAARLRRA